MIFVPALAHAFAVQRGQVNLNLLFGALSRITGIESSVNENPLASSSAHAASNGPSLMM